MHNSDGPVPCGRLSEMEDVRSIITVRSDTPMQCPICRDGMTRGADDSEGLAKRVNHLLSKHEGVRLLHVGQETTRSDDGELWQSIAVLGYDKLLPERPDATAKLAEEYGPEPEGPEKAD